VYWHRECGVVPGTGGAASARSRLGPARPPHRPGGRGGAAALAGARRSSTAYDRFREETLAADLDVAFDGPPGGDLDRAARAIEALPHVEALGRAAFPFVVPEGSGFYPYLDFLAVAALDDVFTRDVDRPRILDGRVPDPERPGEMAVTEVFAGEAGLAVGDRVAFESFTPGQLGPLFTASDAGPPAGPVYRFLVTGIFDTPTSLSESVNSFEPRVFLSRAFLEEHGEDVAVYPGGFTLRLRNGAADVPAVTATLRELFDGTTLELTPAAEVDAKFDASIDVIVAALVLFAVVAGLAGAAAIGQALSRHLVAQSADERWLAAIGMTRRERATAQVATLVPVAIAGAAVAVAAAMPASALMPVGVAGRAEPDPGFSLDATVLGLGFVAIVVAILLLSIRSRARASAARPGSA